MSSATSASTGFYVYAFVRSQDAERVLNNAPVGVNSAQLQVIPGNEVAAVVSEISAKKIRPDRKSLAAHQAIVNHAASQVGMLPVSFGLIADDGTQIENLLSNYRDTLVSQLSEVEGRVEMTLVLRWRSENVFKMFVDKHPELAAARDEMVANGARREDQIALGQMFEKLINAEREQHTNKIKEGIQSICQSIDTQPIRQETEVCRLAALIPRDSVESFGEAVQKVAEGFSDEFEFALSGPWAPYSFVNLVLSLN